MQIQTIGVVGAGTMGNGIAQAFAVAGYPVVLNDIAQAPLDRGMKNVDGSLERLVKKDKMTAEAKATALSRITATPDIAALAGVDLVIEAATENLALKLDLFGRLDALAKPEAIIASNTSSISITKLAAATKRSSQVIGMHFFNPVPVMQLVEVIRGLQTSDQTYAAIEALSKAVGKAPVQVRNSPGFVVNRMLCPMINEAIITLFEGVAGVEEIDTVMKLGMAHPMGPLQLADFIGLDVCLAILDVLYEGFGNPKYKACPLLVNMVTAGKKGVKSGEGFYSWTHGTKELIVADYFKK
jgi:3-hydroxybutyryl-CoA dehydrogenase